jgi:hypothetical protein
MTAGGGWFAGSMMVWRGAGFCGFFGSRTTTSFGLLPNKLKAHETNSFKTCCWLIQAEESL